MEIESVPAGCASLNWIYCCLFWFCLWPGASNWGSFALPWLPDSATYWTVIRQWSAQSCKSWASGLLAPHFQPSPTWCLQKSCQSEFTKSIKSLCWALVKRCSRPTTATQPSQVSHPLKYLIESLLESLAEAFPSSGASLKSQLVWSQP